MPIMPRSNDKCQKIVDDILGKKHKKSGKGPKKESDKEARLTFEETAKAK